MRKWLFYNDNVIDIEENGEKTERREEKSVVKRPEEESNSVTILLW